MDTSAKVAHDISNDTIIRTQDIEISENVDFEGMLLSQRVLNGLKNAGFLRPSPIQLKSIPLGRCGLDLIVQAKAGTGKTCVFTVVALEGLQVESSATQVLVLAPTREIAFQIWQVIMSIGSGIEGLTCATFIGGISVGDDKENLKKCHIAVGTPGRIKFLIEQNYLKTKSIRLFVLDEADQLLDECFQADINWIYSVLPENKQILALSATYPEFMTRHLLNYMRNPTYIRLDVTQLALLGIKQYYLKIPFHPHVQKAAEYSFEAAIKILSSVSFNQCLIFSNLQSGALSLAYKLEELGWPTCCIAGSLEQKERNEAMASLKAFQCRVLISTDLTSRGIDAENVNLVINLDLPRKPRVYLHRIGRAGRFGSQGAAITLVPGDAGLKMLKKVQTVCNTTLEPLPDPIPNDLVSRPCKKPCIKLDDIVHTEIISTHQRRKRGGKNSLEKSTKNLTPKATEVISDSSDLEILSENPGATAAVNGTLQPGDKINGDSELPVAEKNKTSVSEDSSSIFSQKCKSFSETISVSEAPKLKNSEDSIKNTETRKSMDSETKEPQSFPRPNLACNDLPLVNLISVSPWKPTEVPQFKPVPSPGSYSDLCTEFELFTFNDEKEEGEDFQSVLPRPSSSELSLKGEVCKTLDAYYKKVCKTLLGGVTEEKPNPISLQGPSIKKVNNDSIGLNPDEHINPNCDNYADKMNKKDLTVPYENESQQLIADIGHKSLKNDPGSLGNEVCSKPETKQDQTENCSQTGLKRDIPVSRREKYRHLFRCEDEEYFVPDYLPYQDSDEKLQSEKSQYQTADKKAPPKPLLHTDEKAEKTSVVKDSSKKTNAATKDINDEALRSKTQSPSLTHWDKRHTQEHSEDETLNDETSRDSEYFSDSSTFTDSDSSSSYSDSDSDSDTETETSSCSSPEEESMDYPYGQPMSYPQYHYPYPWTQGYPVMAPMNFNPYWTCPNYYYGYRAPFTQPRTDPYSAMKSVSNHYFQQQQNYIKWMTKYYLAQE